MVHGYPFSIGSSGYPVPLGGRDRLIIPGKIVIHDAAFFRVFMEIGNRSTAIRLGTVSYPTDSSSSPQTTTTGTNAATTTSVVPALDPEGTTNLSHRNPTSSIDVAVFNPIPWGPEAKAFLRSLVPEVPSDDEVVSQINVKYLIAPDYEHHMALKGWKEQFPNARILGVEGLPEKKKKDGVPVDYVFTAAAASGKLISAQLLATDKALQASLPLPDDLTAEFDFVYVPQHPNKELIALHKPTKTLLTGDLLFNLPARAQYAAYPKLSPDSGLSFLARYLSIDSWLLRKLLETMPVTAASSLQAIYDWAPETIIPAHGDIVVSNSTARFGNLFQKFIKK